MVRRLAILCSLGALAASLSACSGSSAEAGCVQPQLQTYAIPQLVFPQTGGTLSLSGPGLMYLAYPPAPNRIAVGTFTLAPTQTPSAGKGVPFQVTSSLPPGSSTPNAGFSVFYVGSVGKLAPQTNYTLTYTITYTLGCLAGSTTKSFTSGTFTTTP